MARANLQRVWRCLNQVVRLNFLQALLAIILGNVVYFALAPTLPFIARHRPFRVDLGMVIDFWICLVIYGLFRTLRRGK